MSSPICRYYPHIGVFILFSSSAAAVFVKTGVAGVVILAVEFVGDKAQALTVTIKVKSSRTKGFVFLRAI